MTNQLKPVWLLDVDGVLNVAASWLRNPELVEAPTHAWPVDEWVDTHAWGGQQRWRIMVARPVLDFIRKVHEAGAAEIRWHTTWQDHAVGLAEVLDLPKFPVQEAPEFFQPGRHLIWGEWWKLPAVIRVLGEGRRVVWTDDDADTDLTPEQAVTLTATGCLIVAPDHSTGLCRNHLDAIARYLNVPQLAPAEVRVGETGATA